MPTFAPVSGGKTQKEILEAGTYPVRIYEYVHLGTQKGEWEGLETNKYKIRFTFEFPTEKRTFNEEKGEQPMVMSADFTLSFHEKSTLRKLAEACYGKMTDAEGERFDIDTLLGATCLVSVAHKPPKDGIVYAYISGYAPLMKGLTVEKQINPSRVLTFQEWNEEIYQSLPNFVKEKIAASPEYRMMKGVIDHGNVPNIDDTPF